MNPNPRNPWITLDNPGTDQHGQPATPNLVTAWPFGRVSGAKAPRDDGAVRSTPFQGGGQRVNGSDVGVMEAHTGLKVTTVLAVEVGNLFGGIWRNTMTPLIALSLAARWGVGKWSRLVAAVTASAPPTVTG